MGNKKLQTRLRGKKGCTAKYVTRDNLHGLYCDDELSLEEIGSRFGVTRQAVLLWCKKLDIPVRNKSEARLLALRKGKFAHTPHNFNRRFFDEWSPKMAYILGLVFADGHISSKGTGALRFGFGGNSELPSIISDLMASDRPFKKSVIHGFHILNCNFASKEMVVQLQKLGVPRGKKSHIMRFPMIPTEMYRHFIRGYFDGDGSVGHGPRVKFTSASKSFLVGVRNVLAEMGLSHRCIYTYEHKPQLLPQGGVGYGSATNELIYCARGDIVKLFALFYDDVPNGQFINTKKEKFVTIIDG